MRADAARNLDTVLHVGARLLAQDPATSIATIAATAGVDRRTVYRRFATREALLAGVYQAKLDASERALDDARLTEAPVAVALHRYVEGIIPVIRRWSIQVLKPMMNMDVEAAARSKQLGERLDRFIQRATDEGLLRADLPPGWVRTLLDQLVNATAENFPDLAAAPAADLVVDALLRGVGRS
ncbi:helix-turn-helix transcriptional regulator [Micromonospora sp. M51]|uniref:TetR/AcrR family transcriptional regulator n=1 Tax=Micromonospora parva TaxID=1464048 RepID=A0ABW6W0I5_9ACTN|nr:MULTISPECIES: TetR/AcrR family transcriptional regulator [Micromonospora]MBQ1010405.1 helix-turn-helix transcriptional regulator [Micromonospora sp. M51]MBQ1030638.1 helix-turn-helix transcriptional regulator [Micromonospora sp. C97]